ncbi:MAG: DUF1853 family protein [Planctomycetaceae bacterium]|nr:DUF1853 family protein [Planctomycetaceae bacterium]
MVSCPIQKVETRRKVPSVSGLPPQQTITSAQFAADLLWAVASPSLITAAAITECRLPERPTLDDRAADCGPRSLGPGDHRVGRYFERLIEHHIRQQPDWELLHCGRQIEEAGRTVGELDFVFRSGGDVYHVETAVKFYLYLPDRTCGGSQFVGPNSRDNFETKLQRLLTHQLPLSRIWQPEVTIRQPHVKGIIFYPVDDAGPDNLLEGMSPDHQRGVWFPAAHLPEFLARRPDPQRALFHIHGKPHWLATPTDSNTALTGVQLTEAVRRHFQTSPDRPLMISQFDSAQDNPHSRRLFCMPDHWPD